MFEARRSARRLTASPIQISHTAAGKDNKPMDLTSAASYSDLQPIKRMLLTNGYMASVFELTKVWQFL
jgi:hypothetical protein